jgi:hypothetical protein
VFTTGQTLDSLDRLHYGIIPEDEAQILPHYQGFNQKPLAPFLAKLQQSNRASYDH